MYFCMIFIGFHLRDHPFGAGVGKITMRLILEAETSTLDLEKNRLSHFQQISGKRPRQESTMEFDSVRESLG